MIKKIRMNKGWSQEQLAEFSGLSVRTIQRLERGHNAGLKSLKYVAAALDVDISELNKVNVEDNIDFLGVGTILPVKSVKDTVQFYTEKLGFEVDVLWESPPYAVVAREKVVIEFGEGRKKFAGSGICNIFVKDVDLIFKELQGKNIELVGDIADRDYGSRDFRIKDNNGNMLIFSSPLINQRELIKAGSSL